MKDFADWLTEYMEKNNITQYRLEKITGVRLSTINDIVTKKSSPTQRTMQKILNGLKIKENPSDISYEIHSISMKVAENMPKSEDEKAALEILKAMPEDEQRRRIFKEYESLSPEQRQAIDLIIRLLASSH